MPTIYSHDNANISKVWIVVVIVFIGMCIVVWGMARSIQDISKNTAENRIRIGELLSEDY